MATDPLDLPGRPWVRLFDRPTYLENPKAWHLDLRVAAAAGWHVRRSVWWERILGLGSVGPYLFSPNPSSGLEYRRPPRFSTSLDLMWELEERIEANLQEGYRSLIWNDTHASAELRARAFCALARKINRVIEPKKAEHEIG